MQYINQKRYPHWLYVTRTELEGEEREYGKTTTVFTSACGLCSSIMVADRLLPNSDFDLNQAISLSYEVKANSGRGTSFVRYAPAFAEKMGLEYEMSHDLEAVLNCLRTGGVAVALVAGDCNGHPGLFSHHWHYVTVIAQERDGRLAILDPALYPGKFEEDGRRGRVELKYDTVALCDPRELAGDVVDYEIPYYLFWRS